MYTLYYDTFSLYVLKKKNNKKNEKNNNVCCTCLYVLTEFAIENKNVYQHVLGIHTPVLFPVIFTLTTIISPGFLFSSWKYILVPMLEGQSLRFFFSLAYPRWSKHNSTSVLSLFDSDSFATNLYKHIQIYYNAENLHT